MNKILFTANCDSHILLFHLPYLKWFKDNGYEVHVATNTDDYIPFTDVKHKISFKRNPLSIRNFKAILELIKVLKDNNFKIIHTHTPVASVVTRVAHFILKNKSKLIYTCHGFHFYKGAPFYFWLLFCSIEKILMNVVDVLFVMNKEDYEFSKKHFKNVEVRYINGIGFNKARLDKRSSLSRKKEIFNNLNLSQNDFIVSYVAEYSKRKRQGDLLKHLAKTNIKDTNIKVLFIGKDSLNGKLNKLVKKYKLDNVIKFVDFVDDIAIYYRISDLIISCSRQEGLPLNVIESIYMKKIVLATNCRGNSDLVINGTNGFIVNKIDKFYSMICYIKDNYNYLYKNYDRGLNILEYSSDTILNEVSKVYKRLLK
ncbi:MAG: glycosyltransferase [Bacilli bacterium]|nr:glycosyltransferase [Bacilli bacterium]